MCAELTQKNLMICNIFIVRYHQQSSLPMGGSSPLRGGFTLSLGNSIPFRLYVGERWGCRYLRPKDSNVAVSLWPCNRALR